MKKYKLMAQQKVCYQTEGYVALPEVFTQTECREFTIYMMDLQAGRRKLDGFQPRQPDEWGRTHNQHAYDAVAMQWLVDPRLDQPLTRPGKKWLSWSGNTQNCRIRSVRRRTNNARRDRISVWSADGLLYQASFGLDKSSIRSVVCAYCR